MTPSFFIIKITWRKIQKHATVIGSNVQAMPCNNLLELRQKIQEQVEEIKRLTNLPLWENVII